MRAKGSLLLRFGRIEGDGMIHRPGNDAGRPSGLVAVGAEEEIGVMERLDRPRDGPGGFADAAEACIGGRLMEPVLG